MNGGRLSDDAAFTLGIGTLRTQLTQSTPDDDVGERALRMIATRYPEEAEEIRSLWGNGRYPECEQLIDEVIERHQEDNAE